MLEFFVNVSVSTLGPALPEDSVLFWRKLLFPFFVRLDDFPGGISGSYRVGFHGGLFFILCRTGDKGECEK